MERFSSYLAKIAIIVAASLIAVYAIFLVSPSSTSDSNPDYETVGIVLDVSATDESTLVRVTKSNLYKEGSYITFAKPLINHDDDPYSEGDSVSFIHWNSENKSGQIDTYRVEVISRSNGEE